MSRKVLTSPNINLMENASFVKLLSANKQIVGSLRIGLRRGMELRSMRKPNEGEMIIIVGNGASVEVEHIGVVSLKLLVLSTI